MARKWLPYAPAGMPGVWRDLDSMIPTRAGSYYPNNLFTAKVAGNAGLAAPGTTRRAWCALLPADTAVSYVGTTTKLWTYDGASTFTDKSRGGGYTNTATDWSFAQYGNITLATNRVDALQTRDASGAAAFADGTGSPPKSSIIVTQSEQVVLFDLNDGAEKPDAFASCAPGDHTDWSGTGATTATRIRHRPGKITAAVAFRDYILAFKRSSVYKLTYTGSTYKWKVELIAIGRGAWGKHDVVHCGDVVIFTGPGGAWKFDGATFTAITEWFGELLPDYGATSSFFSPLSGNVFFRSIFSVIYVYNIFSDCWGHLRPRGTGTAAVVASDWVMMTGDPAALRTMVAPTNLHPDKMWLIKLTAPIDTHTVAENATYWGNGSGTVSAWLTSGIEGIGGATMTNFSRFQPEMTITAGFQSSDITPGATELKLAVYAGNSKDAYDLDPTNAGSSAVTGLSDLSSSTEQRRFDFQHTSIYACFRLSLPGNSGYTEVTDYEVTMSPDGEL